MAECGVMDQRELVDAAREWQGWGTALKPAVEPIVLARKPLIGTVAANVQKHGTGALNINGCRVGDSGATKRSHQAAHPKTEEGREDRSQHWARAGHSVVTLNAGRWPANLCHDGSEEVMACFPDSAGQQADISTTAPSAKTSNVYGKMNREGEASANRRYTDNGGTNFSALPGQRRGDSGSAARFFFTAKADSHDRIASKHPTVKPLDLMQWLCRLITPKGGTILDPFAGTGTTGEAAWREGFRAILIEREAEYQADIARRMDLAENPTKRAAVAKTKGKIDDHGPLFSGGDPAP
jgi:site-specific DNA-methyltransferase (adenine-specific)